MPTPPFYQVLPDVPTGQPLTTLVDWFAVLSPIDRVNEILNPSIETGTTGYTAGAGALARVATQQYHGTYSLQYTPSAAVTDGCYYTYTTTNAFRAISCKFLGAAGVPYSFALATTGPADLVTYNFKATGYWQWLWLYYNETGATSRRIYWRKNGSASVAPFYVDGVQSEVINNGEFVSTYIDGDQLGLVPNQYPAPYGWSGTPHASTSYRTGQTRAGGQVMPLSLYGWILAGIMGLGMIPPQHASIPYVQLDSSIYERTRLPSRQFSLVGRLNGSSYAQVARLESGLLRNFSRDAVGQQQPLTLLYQNKDECGLVTSRYARLTCTYDGGAEGALASTTAQAFPLNFTMYAPFVQGDSEFGIALSAAGSVSNANYIVMKTAAGIWQALGTGLTGGVARAILPMPDGTYIVGGDFTQAGGVANTAGIAKYTPSTNTWSALGTGAVGGVVYALDRSADGSQIFVAGTFTSMGGVANTRGIAWYDTVWHACQTGLAAGGAYAVLYLTPTTILFGGDQSGTGGVARYDSVANTLNGIPTLAVNVGGQVRTLAAPADNTVLYLGGTFTTVGGVAYSNIAYYTFATTAVTAMGTGTNNTVNSITIGPGAVVYAGGLFTTAGSVTVNRVAQWVGGSWQPLSTGTDGEVSRVATAPNGDIWLAGIFTTAGGVTLLGGVAIWRNGAFTFPDFLFPGTADARGLAFRPDGTVVIGFNSSGTGTGGTSVVLNNPGTARTYPIIVITGPSSGSSRLYSITNKTTNRALYFSVSVNAGETITLNLDPTQLSFISSSRGNLLSTLLPGSNETDFFLQPGNNTLSFFAASSTVGAALRSKALYNTLADVIQ